MTNGWSSEAPAARVAPTQNEQMPTSRYVPLDQPIFSVAQRAQAAANMEERIRAQSARAAAFRTSSDRNEEGEDPAPPSGDVVEVITAGAGSSSHPSRDPDTPNRRERPQGRKKREASEPTMRETKKAKTAQGGDRMQITEEPLNLVALRDFASRRAADTTHIRGCAATLRECIYYFLQCVDKVHAEGLGTMTVFTQQEDDFTCYGAHQWS